MYKALMVYFVVACAVALIITPANAQEDTNDPLAYTATGDELWDAFAEAMLAQFENMTVLVTPNEVVPSSLPMATLVGWKDEFGDDPRYWQLCYWNATVSRMVDGTTGLAPVDYLEQGAARGASDAIAEMLLYKHRRDELEKNWEQYCGGTLPEDSGFSPDIRESTSGFAWFVEQELALVDQLVAACPDESWAWYERAMKRFEYGKWEDGLADLRNGNQAANNRLPLPFPIPFINDRIVKELHCGSEVAAGMAIEGVFGWPFPNFIHLKDQMKNQEVRLHLGAPLNEFEPWHLYTCRLGSMEGASSVQSLVAYVLRGMMLFPLLVETPEAFTLEQRHALWGLHGRARRIKELVKYQTGDDPYNISELEYEMRLIYEKHGLDYREAWPKSIAYTIPAREVRIPGIEVKEIYFRWIFAKHKAENGKAFRWIKECFDMLATFDFATFSWPPPD